MALLAITLAFGAALLTFGLVAQCDSGALARRIRPLARHEAGLIAAYLAVLAGVVWRPALWAAAGGALWFVAGAAALDRGGSSRPSASRSPNSSRSASSSSSIRSPSPASARSRWRNGALRGRRRNGRHGRRRRLLDRPPHRQCADPDARRSGRRRPDHAPHAVRVLHPLPRRRRPRSRAARSAAPTGVRAIPRTPKPQET